MIECIFFVAGSFILLIVVGVIPLWHVLQCHSSETVALSSPLRDVTLTLENE